MSYNHPKAGDRSRSWLETSKTSAPASGAAVSRRLDPQDAEGFARGLGAFRDRLRAAGEEVVIGNVALLGLEAVRQTFAERWEQRRKVIFATIEDVIEQRLRPVDLYVRSADDGYLLLFGAASKLEAEARTQLIAAEVTERLFGTIPPGTRITVASFAVALTPGRIEGRMDLGQLVEAVRAEKSAEDKAASFRFAEGEHFAVDSMPSFEIAERRIATYHIVPRTGDAPSPLEEGIYPPDADHNLRREIDLLILEKAGALMMSGGTPDFGVVAMVPVCYDTLSRRSQAAPYLARLAELAAHLGKARIGLQLLHLPDQIAQSILHAALSPALTHAGQIVARRPRDWRRFKDIQATGIRALVVDGGAVDGGTGGELTPFIADARKAGFPTLVLNLTSRAVALEAVRGGAAAVSGPAVAPAMAAPNRLYRFSLADLGLDH